MITTPAGTYIQIKEVKVKIANDLSNAFTNDVRFYDGHNAKSTLVKRIDVDHESTNPGIESTGSSMYITLWKSDSASNHDIAIHVEFESIGNIISI